jgi:GIY-YIG catalytic domain
MFATQASTSRLCRMTRLADMVAHCNNARHTDLSMIIDTNKKPFRRRRRKKVLRQHCSVYGLAAQDGRIRYIGQTRLDLDRRLRSHFKYANTHSTKLAKWINGSLGVHIVLIDDNATWNVSEILWIDHYRRNGADLVNVLRGGSDSVHALKLPTTYEKRTIV